MRSKKYNIVLVLCSLILLFMLAGCGETPQEEDKEDKIVYEKTGKKPVVTMTMEDGGIVKLELYPDEAPNTVNNFLALAKDGFYDGLIFHRVIEEFMIQGGDPEGTGQGGPGFAISGEFSSNGHENTISHEIGAVSMARTQDPNSAGSQFFIVTGEAAHLNGDYAAFGKVIEGMDVVNKIAAVETDKGDKPVEDQIIKSMTIDLKGYEAMEPVRES